MFWIEKNFLERFLFVVFRGFSKLLEGGKRDRRNKLMEDCKIEKIEGRKKRV